MKSRVPALPFPTGAFHFWALVPLQVQICSWVPLPVLDPGSSRQKPVSWLIKLSFGPRYHCCHEAPRQSESCALAPGNGVWASSAWNSVVLAVRHLPKTRRLPSGYPVHCCDGEPMQSHIWMCVPFAVRPWSSSMHLGAPSERLLCTCRATSGAT